MYYLGIDLGGTNIAVGLVKPEGEIVASFSVPTNAGRKYEEIVKDMTDAVKIVLDNAGADISQIAAAGIGCPGSVDYKKGICTYSNNLKIENAKIAEEFKKYFDIPVFLENDANAAAYGEYVLSGKDAESFVFITLGTGIGGGVVLDGKLFRGFNGAGAELGHMVICSGGAACTCGRKGCWEAYASVTALIRETKAAMEKNPQSLMHSIAAKDGKVSGKTSFLAAKEGDAAAMEVVKKYREYIGEGLTNIVNIFQPDKVVIGGGISREGDYLLDDIKHYVNRYDYNRYMEKTKIYISSQHGDMGIIGAAMVAKSNI